MKLLSVSVTQLSTQGRDNTRARSISRRQITWRIKNKVYSLKKNNRSELNSKYGNENVLCGPTGPDGNIRRVHVTRASRCFHWSNMWERGTLNTGLILMGQCCMGRKTKKTRIKDNYLKNNELNKKQNKAIKTLGQTKEHLMI